MPKIAGAKAMSRVVSGQEQDGDIVVVQSPSRGVAEHAVPVTDHLHLTRGQGRFPKENAITGCHAH
jgi:hypothetical protein